MDCVGSLRAALLAVAIITSVALVNSYHMFNYHIESRPIVLYEGGEPHFDYMMVDEGQVRFPLFFASVAVF